MWGYGGFFPAKEDFDAKYIATSLLYMGAKPPHWEVKRKVVEGGLNTLFKNLKQLGGEIKKRCAEQVIQTHSLSGVSELSRSDMFKLVSESVSNEMRQHQSFQKNYSEFKEGVFRFFGIKVDVVHQLTVDVGEKETVLSFALYIVLEDGSPMFESSMEFWDKLVYYFSKCDPPIFFVKNMPPE